MRLLIIKTSSLGDVIHTLPALTDAYQHYPELRCDWVVEENFAEIPCWHPAVNRVIPIALRRWRKRPWKVWAEVRQFIRNLRQQQYDWIIDAQGLVKSAVLTYWARGTRCGLDYQSAREPLATLAYQHRYAINKAQHAVTRVRQLFAAALNYPISDTVPNYGIRPFFSNKLVQQLPTIVFLHGTTWRTKQWPESHWIALAQRVIEKGYQVCLPWGNPEELARAQRIAATHLAISLLPPSNLHRIATLLIQAQAVVGVDTGLAHLAAALNVPTLTLYGATQPTQTGTYGQQQLHLQAQFPCAPCLRKQCHYRKPSIVYPACYNDLSVDKVWALLETQLGIIY